MTSHDLLKIAQLYLDGGAWQGRRIVPAAWVKASITPHARIDQDTEYGYLWWLKSFQAGTKRYPAFFMSGNGGNKIIGLPSLDMAVAIASTNYNTRGMQERTDRLVREFVPPQ